MIYYYLVSSLPEIRFGEVPPLSMERFLFQCSDILSTQDQSELELVLRGDAAFGSSSFSSAWSNADTQIRSGISRYRAATHAVDAAQFVREYSGVQMSIEYALQKASSKDNPLERERVIASCRWRILEELALRSPFGTEAVLAYGLKLQIAANWAALDKEQGRLRFNEVAEEILSAWTNPA